MGVGEGHSTSIAHRRDDDDLGVGYSLSGDITAQRNKKKQHSKHLNKVSFEVALHVSAAGATHRDRRTDRDANRG